MFIFYIMTLNKNYRNIKLNIWDDMSGLYMKLLKNYWLGWAVFNFR